MTGKDVLQEDMGTQEEDRADQRRPTMKTEDVVVCVVQSVSQQNVFILVFLFNSGWSFEFLLILKSLLSSTLCRT